MEIIEIFGFLPKGSPKIPLFSMSVSAGIPIPVDNDIETEVDLNEFLVEHPAATFFARVKGDDMLHEGIRDGDILIVDTSVEAKDGSIVVVSINGDFTVKVYREINGEAYLESAKHQILPIMEEEYVKLKQIGIVTKIIHSL